MNTRRDTIDELLARWTAGRTTDEEERTLRDLLCGTEELPDDLRAARLLFEGLEALAAERMPVHSERPRLRSRAVVRVFWGAVAAALAAGLFLGAGLLRRPYCYIDGEAVYDRERAMAATHYLDGLSELAGPSQMVDRLIECTE